MNKQLALAFILDDEERGKLVRGLDGWSKWGISEDNHPELNAEQIQNMTRETAAGILGGPQYWGAIHGDELPDWIQLPVLDAAVNEGATAAMVQLQHALFLPGDGKFGPQTLRAAISAAASPTLARFAAERVMGYSRDRTWATDGLGWTTRAVLASLSAQSGSEK